MNRIQRRANLKKIKKRLKSKTASDFPVFEKGKKLTLKRDTVIMPVCEFNNPEDLLPLKKASAGEDLILLSLKHSETGINKPWYQVEFDKGSIGWVNGIALLGQ